ncbi:MAG: DUF1330 domain-containing protein [Methyloligellaceae bacterium]
MSGYFVTLSDVKDPEVYGVYVKQAPGVMADFTGTMRVRGGQRVHLEGPQSPDRIVIVEFDSLEQGVACYNSPEYDVIKSPAKDAADVIISGLTGEKSQGLEPGNKAGILVVKLRIHDKEKYAAYSAEASKTLPGWDAALIAVGPLTPVLGDETYESCLLLRYPSLEKAVEYYNWSEYQKLIPQRQAVADTQMFAVEGL